jgi:B12-binding domain/radical SAM domain protein
MRIAVFSPEIYTYGAMTIGGIIKDAGYDVSITRDPSVVHGDYVFISLYSTQHLMEEQIFSLVKRLKSEGSRVIIGGPTCADPQMVHGELNPDLVVTGEGEPAVLKILQGDDWEKIPNCAFIRDKQLITTSKERLADISRPLPLIPDDISTQDIRGAQTYIETHRGCFGRCGFCQVPLSFGRKIRSRPLEEIFQEVRAFKEKGVRRIALIGGTGSLYLAKDEVLNEGAFIDLLKGLAEILGPKNVSCPDIRADCITDKILDAVRTYSVGWIFFGIESGSPHVLDLMQKNIYPETVERAFDQCREHGVRAAGSFITGYPGETLEDHEMTKDLIERICPDDVFISSAEPIPSTPLADLVVKTMENENPAFITHKGEFEPLHLTEAEARAFDLMLHADSCRMIPRLTTDDLYHTYLNEVKKQGDDIRRATRLLQKYHAR